MDDAVCGFQELPHEVWCVVLHLASDDVRDCGRASALSKFARRALRDRLHAHKLDATHDDLRAAFGHFVWLEETATGLEVVPGRFHGMHTGLPWTRGLRVVSDWSIVPSRTTDERTACPVIHWMELGGRRIESFSADLVKFRFLPLPPTGVLDWFTYQIVYTGPWFHTVPVDATMRAYVPPGVTSVCFVQPIVVLLFSWSVRRIVLRGKLLLCPVAHEAGLVVSHGQIQWTSVSVEV